MSALLALFTPLLALATSLLVIWAIRYLDVVERESRGMIAMAVGVGCLTATVASQWALPEFLWKSFGFGEAFVDFMMTVVDAPVWEELLKGAGLVILFKTKRDKFDSLTDFVIYACAVAIGFELVENILYQWAQLDGKDQLANWIDEVNGRMLGSAGTHAMFSAWLGLGAWAWFRRKKANRLAISSGCVLISMALHASNNLAAVLGQYGPPSETVPINRLGSLIGIVNSQLSLAMFLALVIICVLRDLFFLSDYSYRLLPHLSGQESKIVANRHLEGLRELMNPINHVLAGSKWSWNHLGGNERVIGERLVFGEFARLAMSPARASFTADAGKNFDERAWIQEGLALLAKAC